MKPTTASEDRTMRDIVALLLTLRHEGRLTAQVGRPVDPATEQVLRQIGRAAFGGDLLALRETLRDAVGSARSARR